MESNVFYSRLDAAEKLLTQAGLMSFVPVPFGGNLVFGLRQEDDLSIMLRPGASFHLLSSATRRGTLEVRLLSSPEFVANFSRDRL